MIAADPLCSLCAGRGVVEVFPPGEHRGACVLVVWARRVPASVGVKVLETEVAVRGLERVECPGCVSRTAAAARRLEGRTLHRRAPRRAA